MTMSFINNNFNNGNMVGQFGDTTLTKVFVGGLAWETQKEAMREHFEKYGDILEAVIISDKITGRSKGYGFVTFREPESAKEACEDATPVINGRRANCNLASLGARRPRSSSATPVLSPQGSNVGPRSTSAAPVNLVQWYYPAGNPATHYHHQHAVPYHPYAYSPTYIAADYNPKVGYSGGSYMNGHFSQVYPPVYPHYRYHHQTQMGVPAAHMYPSTTASVPTIISKPPSMAPNAVCLAVE